MRKFAVAFMFVVAIIALPLNSFASDLLFFQKNGSVEGLQFYFGLPGDPGLPIDLSAIGINPFNALYADIKTSGREIAIIDPDTKDYYYYGSYGSGKIIATTAEGETVKIPMLSATLVEHFVIEGSIEDAINNPFTVETPANTSLMFKAVLGKNRNKVNFALIIKDGELLFSGTY